MSLTDEREKSLVLPKIGSCHPQTKEKVENRRWGGRRGGVASPCVQGGDSSRVSSLTEGWGYDPNKK